MTAPRPTLAELTTIRLGGPAGALVTATTTDELVGAIRSADGAGTPVLLVGDGSNLIVADAGWPGVVVLIRTRGISWSAAESTVTVAAGEPWEPLVAASIEAGWSGLETMSGIPGRTGATPVQNVGAYGREISDVLEAITVFDRDDGSIAAWPAARCGFGFRTSAFKHTERYVILDVTLRLRRSPDSAPVRYAELARRLGIAQHGTAPTARVRQAVLELRRSKGMLLDATRHEVDHDPDPDTDTDTDTDVDHDTWSVGSFFVNPRVESSLVPAGCPHWADGDRVKLSAAWLIEQAGFQRGYGLDQAPGTVSVSTKHTLALTNRGGASTADLLDLARRIRAGVRLRFGIQLEPEPRLAGVRI